MILGGSAGLPQMSAPPTVRTIVGADVVFADEAGRIRDVSAPTTQTARSVLEVIGSSEAESNQSEDHRGAPFRDRTSSSAALPAVGKDSGERRSVPVARASEDDGNRPWGRVRRKKAMNAPEARSQAVIQAARIRCLS